MTETVERYYSTTESTIYDHYEATKANRFESYEKHDLQVDFDFRQ